MKVSQSGLRDFYNPEYCQIRWEETYINGYRGYPTAAMLDGLVFEQNVIGMSRGGDIYEIPKLKNGKPSKRETDLLKLATEAKNTIMDLDIKLLDIQPEWETKDLIGHPDALITYKGDKAIMDLKYTAIREDESCRWNPYAWHDLEYKDFSQAIHYIELYYRMKGEYLPFFYLVFGKSGWVKFISIDLSHDSLINYRKKLKDFKEDINDFNPEPINKYEICRKCPITCDKRTLQPEIISVQC